MTSIDEEVRYQARVEIEHKFVQSLIMINAGAVVSLLGFLQAIWSQSIDLSKVALVGILIFGAGLVSAVLVNLFRYRVNTFRASDQGKKQQENMTYSIWSRYISLGCFIVGLLYVSLMGIAAIGASSVVGNTIT